MKDKYPVGTLVHSQQLGFGIVSEVRSLYQYHPLGPYEYDVFWFQHTFGKMKYFHGEKSIHYVYKSYKDLVDEI